MHSVHPRPFLLRGGWGGGVEPPTKFQKGGLNRTSTFRGGLLEKRGVTFSREGGGFNFHIKNKVKSEIFNDKKT